MVHAGHVYANPGTQETGTVLVGGGDTEGRYLHAENHVEPGGGVSFLHSHPEATERFAVVSGHFGVHVDGKEQVLEAGGRVTVEAGQVHRWWNAGDEELVYRCEVWPAARFEQMILTFIGLGLEGKLDAKGAPSPLQMAVILDEFDDVMRLAQPPRWLQRLVIPPLAGIGRSRGLRATSPHHAELYAAMQAGVPVARTGEGVAA